MWAHWIRIGRVLLLVQLVAGALVVVTLAQRDHEPALETRVAVQGERQGDLERRVRILEELRVAERLAVLDDIKADSKQTKYLTYGAIIALAGNFVFGFMDYKARRDQAGEE